MVLSVGYFNVFGLFLNNKQQQTTNRPHPHSTTGRCRNKQKTASECTEVAYALVVDSSLSAFCTVTVRPNEAAGYIEMGVRAL
eukprot:5380918-Amphidinium_carterae.1